MREYDILEFKKKGFVAYVVGGILKLLQPSWDFYGWHTSILLRRKDDHNWWVMEATGMGVQINEYSEEFLLANTRQYHWLDKFPTFEEYQAFLDAFLGKPYDVAIYFWTALQYLFRHFWNKRIPRLLDDRYTCWELVSEFCDCMDKPLVNKYDCPMLPDMLEKLKPYRVQEENSLCA